MLITSQWFLFQLHHRNWNKYVKLKSKMPSVRKQENSAKLDCQGEIQLEVFLKPYWKARAQLTLCDPNLLYNSRVVIPPPSLRKDILLRMHKGHQGVERCRMRVRQSVWWPGVSQVQQFVENCRECSKQAKPRKEPLLPTPYQIIHGK